MIDYALEAAAVAAFESFLRQQATESRGRSVQNWHGLEPDDRDHWRKLVKETISADLLRHR